MQQYKFKAYIKELGKVYDVLSLHMSPEKEGFHKVSFLEEGEVKNYRIDRVDNHLMMWTGKYDKDKQEIYSGQIVRAVYKESEGGGWYSNHRVLGVVYFDNNWGVKFDCREKMNRTASSSWYSTIPQTEFMKNFPHWSDEVQEGDYNNVEIIGTVFENPELLT